jgi:alpha-glucosidase (family GH31 glycosyl hydrolase)
MPSFAFADNELTVQTPRGEARFGFTSPDILRYRFTPGAPKVEETFVVEHPPCFIPARLSKSSGKVRLATTSRVLEVTLSPFSFRVTDPKGRLILSTPNGKTAEVRHEPRTLAAHRMNKIAPPPTGLKQVTVARFELKKDEKVYGLGQDPMANLDQRGHERRMWHEWAGKRRSGNDGMPFFITSAGWGCLVNSSWAMRFAVGEAKVGDGPTDFGWNWCSAPWAWDQHSGENHPDRMAILLDDGVMDLFLILRDRADGLLAGYAALTGASPIPPKWALGFIQCKNRYRTQEEFRRVAREYRRRGLPLDVLVIDWMWFKDFGDLSWDLENWPDPKALFAEMKKLNVKVLQAQHPYMTRTSRLYESYKSRGFINDMPGPGNPSVDHSNPAARKAWWGDIKPLFELGVRGYWTDMGELEHHPPATKHFLGARERVHNIYTLLWTKGLYEGQRKDFTDRVFNLARSTWAGVQRYGTTLWSGDIEASWEVFRDQVVIGQGVSLSGQPWWCTDAGGFMTYRPFTPELYARWFEWGVFNALFRTHGTKPENEAWTYGPAIERIVADHIALRYRLMPYIYSLARQVHLTGAPIMRPMLMDFPDDPKAVAATDQFMFGPSILVAPVLHEDARTREVYLPKGDWYDFRTGERIKGGRTITVGSPLYRIPTFARAGSVILMGPEMAYALEKPLTEVTVHTYAGKAGSFTQYDDDGLTYGYEKGQFAETPLTSDIQGRLKVGKVIGNPGVLPKGRRYKSVVHGGKRGVIRLNPVEIHVDHDLKTGGVLKIHALIENRTGKTLGAKAAIVAPAGWGVDSKPDPDLAVKVGELCHLVWELSPQADALPVLSQARITVEVLDGTKIVKKQVSNVEWGSGWPAWFSVVGSFDNKGGKGLDRVYGPEKNADLASYGKGLSWLRAPGREFTCFGYVDFRECGVTFPEQGVAYAKCSVWSDKARTVYVEAAGDDSMKAWVNGKLVVNEKGLLLKTLFKKPVSLKKGWNKVLIKVAAQCTRPWSGREYGFQFRFTDKSGKAMKEILYRAY